MLDRCAGFLLVLLLVSPAVAQSDGEDWPWFLGPQHTGVSSETDLNVDWPAEGPPILWEKKVGTGYSAPSVRGDRLVVHHRVADEEITECVEAGTGKRLWTYRTPSNFVDPFGYNNGPRCSPVLSADRCYTLGAGGHLACVRLDSGERVWSRDLHEEYQIPRAFFGIGCSPILEGDKLIVLVGGQLNSGVVAFDARTGQREWSGVGKQTWNGVEQPRRGPYEWTGQEQVVSYSSPIAVTIRGQRHLLCLMRQGLVSLDPATGEERFKYWFRPFPDESVNAARPVVVGDQILLSAAYRQGSALLKVNEDGKGVTELWRDRENLLAHWSTPIVVDDCIYGFSGRHENEGELRCLDLATGKVRWRSDGYDRAALGQIVIKRERRDGVIVTQYIHKDSGREVPYPLFGRGSKIRIGDKFIILGERGLLTVARINPDKYDEVSRTSFRQIQYPAWAAPVLSRRKLYLRSEDTLLCLDIGKQ